MEAICENFHMSPAIAIILLDDRVQIALRGPNGNDGLLRFMSEVIHSTGEVGLDGAGVFRALVDAGGETQNLMEQIHNVVKEMRTRDEQEGIMPLRSYPEPAAIALWALANRIVEAYGSFRANAWVCYPSGLFFVSAGATGTPSEQLEAIRAGPRFWTFYCTEQDEEASQGSLENDVIIVEPLTKKSRPSPPESPVEFPEPEPDREPEPDEDDLLKDVLETKRRMARPSVSTKEILDELEEEQRNGTFTPHHPEEPKPEPAPETAAEPEAEPKPDPADLFMKMMDDLEKKD